MLRGTQRTPGAAAHRPLGARQPPARHAPAAAGRGPPGALVWCVRDRGRHGPRRAEPHGRSRRARRRPTASTSSRARCGPANACRSGVSTRTPVTGTARGAWAPSSAPPATRPTGPGSATRCGGCGTPKRAKASGCGPTNLPRASGPDDAWEVADAQCEWWTAPNRARSARARDRVVRSRRVGCAARRRCSLRSTRATDSLATPTDADLAHAFEAGAAVLTHLRADPLLPVALCPAAWPGDRLRAAYAEYQHAFGAAVREWFRAGA